MINKTANTRYPVSSLIKNRWSPRAFSSEKIPEESIMALFESASWSPSSRNEQPWRFIYGLKDEDETYLKIFHTLVHWNQQWANTAPLLVLSIAKLKSDFHNKDNVFALYDLGQAVAHLTLQATFMGLFCHQMGGFDKEKAMSLFNIPVGYTCLTVIAIGYMGNPDLLPVDLKELEEKPRTRYEFEKLIFNGDFKG
jgi:nitroreductase